MTSKRKLIAAAALSAALAGGGLVGAVLGTPSLTGAQEAEDDASTSTPTAEEGIGFRHHRGAGLEAAAEALGMTVGELRDALDEDTSIADVAAERGVDVQTVIDAMVAEATERIDEKVADGDIDAERAETLKAELAERITAAVNGERPAFGRFGPGGPGRHGHRFGHRLAGLDAAAEALGIAVDELRDALDEDTSIADVAAERGVDVQTVIDAMVADANERLDEMRATLEERITALVNGEAPAADADAPEADAA